MPEKNKSGSAKMRPRARIIGLIGDELISDEPVALVELVKNAYDADATEVEVRFEGAEDNNPEKITVIDDGIGMDLETVLEGWFEPGTILKRKKDVSPGGRVYQGAKGIGRFAAARLAEFMVLESKKSNGKEGVYVLLDWGKFKEESYLDEISLEYEIRHFSDFDHGTRLILEGVRKKRWSQKDYEDLHSRLSRLISPFEDVTDFSILLQCPAFPEFSGIVHPPELILRPKYHLQGGLSEDGYFEGKIICDNEIIRKFEGKHKKLNGKDVTPECGPFQVEIRAWDRDREGLEPFIEKLGMSLLEIRRTLDTYCGVGIYRDGFRVYPYGQKGNDWLNIDLRSRQKPAMGLANNQIVAAIRISRENNPDLKDRSTREGMVYNAEHIALEKWFIEILQLLEEERYKIRPRKESASYNEPLFEGLDIRETVKFTHKTLGKDHKVSKKISETEKQVNEAVERAQQTFSRLLMLAGIGHMVDMVIHEIGAPLGKVYRQIDMLKKAIQDCSELDVKITNKVTPMFPKIKSWLDQISTLRQRLEPQTPGKRGKATTFDVMEEIEDNFALYESLINKQNIDFKISPEEQSIKVKMARAALGQILASACCET